jgi:hypothetical protein
VRAEIRDITVTVHLKIDLPDDIPFVPDDIDIKPRFRLETPGLTFNLDDVAVPLLAGINLAIQDATVRNLQAQLAAVRNLDLGAGNFSDVKIEGVKLPTGGFNLFGLELGALALGAFGVPAAATRSVALGGFKPQGPLTLPATEVTGIKLPETNVPEAMSTGAITLRRIEVGPIPLVTTDDIPGPVDLDVSVEITLDMTVGRMVIRDLGLSIAIDRLALKNLRVPVSVKDVTVGDVGLEQVRANQISV